MSLKIPSLPAPVQTQAAEFDTDKNGTLDESEVLVANAFAQHGLGTATEWSKFETESGKQLAALLATERGTTRGDAAALAGLQARAGDIMGTEVAGAGAAPAGVVPAAAAPAAPAVLAGGVVPPAAVPAPGALAGPAGVVPAAAAPAAPAVLAGGVVPPAAVPAPGALAGPAGVVPAAAAPAAPAVLAGGVVPPPAVPAPGALAGDVPPAAAPAPGALAGPAGVVPPAPGAAPAATAATATADISGDFSRLTPGQRQVLEATQQKAVARAQAARPALVARFASLGFSEAQLDATLAYLRTSAPVTINFKPDQMTRTGEPLAKAMQKSGAYFSTWESAVTNSWGVEKGGARYGWERTVYEGAFEAANLPDADRPKYTALNATRDSNGGANAFGTCYFVAKNGLKQRSVVLPDDIPRVKPEEVGSFEHLENTLLAVKDNNLLTQMVKAAAEPTTEQTRGYGWQEVHVFGPIDLGKDVEALVVADRFKGTPYEADLRALATQYGIELRWSNGAQTRKDGA